jgi:hypothetical protein
MKLALLALISRFRTRHGGSENEPHRRGENNVLETSSDVDEDSEEDEQEHSDAEMRLEVKSYQTTSWADARTNGRAHIHAEGDVLHMDFLSTDGSAGEMFEIFINLVLVTYNASVFLPRVSQGIWSRCLHMLDCQFYCCYNCSYE